MNISIKNISIKTHQVEHEGVVALITEKTYEQFEPRWHVEIGNDKTLVASYDSALALCARVLPMGAEADRLAARCLGLRRDASREFEAYSAPLVEVKS